MTDTHGKANTTGNVRIWDYDEIIRAVISLKPCQARKFSARQRRVRCVSVVIFAVRLPDGVVVYFDNGPWIRACYVRVSSEKQRSGQLLAGEDVLDADEAPGSSEEGWSEAVQIERLLDYCVATPAENGTLPSIAFYNDSSLSGRLTTDDTALIQDVNNKHSTLYKEVFTKVFLSPSYTKNLQPDEITAREQYRDAVVAKIAEGFKDAATTADIEILRKRRRYKSDFNFRPAICELVADIEKREIGEVLFTDLSRFFRGP